MKNLFKIIFFITCIYQPVKAQVKALATNELKEYNTLIELKGKITTELFYGAPGYGEDTLHDKKVYPFILVLANKIDVKKDKENESEKNVEKIQISFPSGKIEELKKLKNKQAIIKGKLYHAMVATQYTTILIDAIKIEPSK